MTDRLKAICSLIPYSQSFIDVGCDHGMAVEFVLENGLAKKVAACDISLPSLKKAQARLEGKEYANIELCFLHADGAYAAKGYETVLISGMGGDEIATVIKNVSPKYFVLSPHTHSKEVRTALLLRDYHITDDFVIKDGGKYYDVIKAQYGGGIKMQSSISEASLNYGMFLNVYNPVLEEKLLKEYKKLHTYKQTEENVKKLTLLKEAIRCQQR